jgi:hypothetical protein
VYFKLEKRNSKKTKQKETLTNLRPIRPNP